MRKLKTLGVLVVTSVLGACSLIGNGPAAHADKTFYKNIMSNNYKRADALLFYNEHSSNPTVAAKGSELDAKHSMVMDKISKELHTHGGLKHIEERHTMLYDNDTKAVVETLFIFKDGYKEINKDHMIKVKGKWMINTNPTNAALK